MRLSLAGRPPDADATLLAVPRRTALLAAYTAATIVLGLGALAAAILLLVADPAAALRPAIGIAAGGLEPGLQRALGVAAWIVYGLAGGTRILRDPGGHAALTFHLPFIAAATMLGGPVAGMLVAALGTVDARELREAPWYGIVANHAGLVLAALAGGLSLESVMRGAVAVGLGDGLVVMLLAGIAGSAVLAAVSAILAAGVVVLRDGLPAGDTIALMDRAFRRTAAAETLLGWIFAVVWLAAGWWAPILCTAVALTLWRAAADADAVDHDELTGVLSRKAFALRAAEAAERARRGIDGAAYLFLDLDDFKRLNDGPRSHLVGDQVLAALGERLRLNVRVTDAVGRRGGDEFMVLFNGVRDEATAVRLAGRLLAAIREPIPTDDGAKRVDASIGIALAIRGNRDYEPDLRARADSAMYQAKAAGGGIRVGREPTESGGSGGSMESAESTESQAPPHTP